MPGYVCAATEASTSASQAWPLWTAMRMVTLGVVMSVATPRKREDQSEHQERTLIEERRIGEQVGGDPWDGDERPAGPGGRRPILVAYEHADGRRHQRQPYADEQRQCRQS